MVRKRTRRTLRATSHYDYVDFRVMQVEEYLPNNTTDTPDRVYYTMVLMPGRQLLTMKVRDDIRPDDVKREIIDVIRKKMLDLRDPEYQYRWEKE